MAKGSFLGGGTMIGPRDVAWFGNSGVENGRRDDADAIARRMSAPLTPQAERQIAKLRIDLTGLRRQLADIDRLRAGIATRVDASARDLAALLHRHGLPPDPGTHAPVTEAGSGKTTRHQRRKRAPEKHRNGQ